MVGFVVLFVIVVVAIIVFGVYRTIQRRKTFEAWAAANGFSYSMQLPEPLGELEVGREGFGAKLARAVGFHDIDIVLVERNRLAPENIRPQLDYLNQVVGRIPDIVWKAS